MASTDIEWYARSASAEYAFNGVDGDIMSLNPCLNPQANNKKHLDLIVDHFEVHDTMTPAISQTLATTIVLTMMYKLSQQSITTIDVKVWISWMQLILHDVINTLNSKDEPMIIEKLNEFVDYHFGNMHSS